jgi:hypothetical protein
MFSGMGALAGRALRRIRWKPSPRQVILEYPIRRGWMLGEETKPEDSSATHYRFRIAVEPGKTEKFSVKESRPEVMRIYLSTLTDTQLAAFVHEGTIKPAVEAELRKTMGKKFEIFNVEQEIKSRQQETELIDKDQARLRATSHRVFGHWIPLTFQSLRLWDLPSVIQMDRTNQCNFHCEQNKENPSLNARADIY